jgi:hypothetical protein
VAAVGYGDLTSHTTGGRVFSTLAMVLGAGLFSYGVSMTVNALADMSAEETAFAQKMQAVNQWMAARELPPALRGEIREVRLSVPQRLSCPTALLPDGSLPQRLSCPTALLPDGSLPQRLSCPTALFPDGSLS